MVESILFRYTLELHNFFSDQKLKMVLVEKHQFNEVGNPDSIEISVEPEEVKELTGNDYFLLLYDSDCESLFAENVDVENEDGVVDKQCKLETLRQDIIENNSNSNSCYNSIEADNVEHTFSHDLNDDMSLNNFPFVEEIICDKNDDNSEDIDCESNQSIVVDNIVLDTKFNEKFNISNNKIICFENNGLSYHDFKTDLKVQNNSALLNNNLHEDNTEASSSEDDHVNPGLEQNNTSEIGKTSENLQKHQIPCNSDKVFTVSSNFVKLENIQNILKPNYCINENCTSKLGDFSEVFMKDEFSNNSDDIFVNKSLKFSKIEDIQDILQKVKSHNFRSVKVVNRNTREIIEYRSIENFSVDDINSSSNISNLNNDSNEYNLETSVNSKSFLYHENNDLNTDLLNNIENKIKNEEKTTIDVLSESDINKDSQKFKDSASNCSDFEGIETESETVFDATVTSKRNISPQFSNHTGSFDFNQSCTLDKYNQNGVISKNKYIYIDPNKIEQDFNSNINNLNYHELVGSKGCSENSANDTNSNYEFFDMVFKKLLNDRYKVKRKIKLNPNLNLSENDNVFQDSHSLEPKQNNQNYFATKDRLDQRHVRKSVITHAGRSLQNNDYCNRKHKINFDVDYDISERNIRFTDNFSKHPKLSEDQRDSSSKLPRVCVKNNENIKQTDIKSIDILSASPHPKPVQWEEKQEDYGESVMQACTNGGSIGNYIIPTNEMKTTSVTNFQYHNSESRIEQRRKFYLKKPKIQRRHSISAIYYNEASFQNMNRKRYHSEKNNASTDQESVDVHCAEVNNDYKDIKSIIRKWNCIRSNAENDIKTYGEPGEYKYDTSTIFKDRFKSQESSFSNEINPSTKILLSYQHRLEDSVKTEIIEPMKLNSDVYEECEIELNFRSINENLSGLLDNNKKITGYEKPKVVGLHNDKFINNNNDSIENNNKFDADVFKLKQEFDVKSTPNRKNKFTRILMNDNCNEIKYDSKKFKYELKEPFLYNFDNERNDVITGNGQQSAEYNRIRKGDDRLRERENEGMPKKISSSNSRTFKCNISTNNIKQCDTEFKMKSNKRNFEDTLSSIDEQYHNRNSKKKHIQKYVIPKLVIKKDDYGVHYASEKDSNNYINSPSRHEKEKSSKLYSPKNEDKANHNVCSKTKPNPLKLRLCKTNRKRRNILSSGNAKYLGNKVPASLCISQTKSKGNATKLIVDEIPSKGRDTDLKLEAFSNFNTLSVNLEKREDINCLCKIPGSRIKVLPNDNLTVVNNARSFESFGANTINIDGLSESSKGNI